ncbi:MAG TPA: methylenetetrahydrofolate reductase C-terminal domain-containing protein, partial [Candidatus Polarisedimenticolia bacterium]|nr:methylenetetrahydrofolate reductase C-terminal domain-containing protein [Candidatus Polarisedimenticolia bacterium]
KTLRNGPCGGVRLDGHCEVVPEMACVWVRAERRSRWLPWRGAILRIQPSLDWSQKGRSAWVNALSGLPRGDRP